VNPNQPLEEKDFPEAIDALMAEYGDLIQTVVLQSFGDQPEYLAQGKFQAGFYWDSAEGFPMYTIGQEDVDQILWIKWRSWVRRGCNLCATFDKGEVFTDAQVCRKNPTASD
jgi:hypothetical protein